MSNLIKSNIPQEIIENKILLIRGKKVMLDRDLAKLYGVQTKSLNLSVKRNIDRFPEDFMFKLNKIEYKNLRFQIETSKRGGTRYLPYVFTENGIAMLSSVLNSKRAIQVNIRIMRIFTKIREIMIRHQNLQKRIDQMEQKYGKQIMTIFQVLKQLSEKISKTSTESTIKHKIGFHATDVSP